ALERCLAATSGVLLTVALDAPAHRQRPGGGPEAEKPDQVIAELRPRVGSDHPHPLDRAVARLALEPEADVGLVREVGELGDLEDADPGDRLATLRMLVDLRDLGIVLSADDLVAAQASLDRRKPGVLGAARVRVAVLARDLERAGMDHVVEENGLARRA